MVETQKVIKQLRLCLKKCATPHNAPSKVQAAEESKERGNSRSAGPEDSFPDGVCSAQKALVCRRGG